MEPPISIFSNPAVISGGIGGIIAIILMGILYKVLTRIDDSIHEFIKGQQNIVLGMSGVADKIVDAFHETSAIARSDQQATTIAIERLQSKLDVLLDRTGRTFEQIAIHRGVSEPPLVGTPPAIVPPIYGNGIGRN